MMNIDTVVYNIAVFIAALFLLEIGADKFIDHTAIVAHRTGIPQTLVALLTAGGEWEEVRYQLQMYTVGVRLPANTQCHSSPWSSRPLLATVHLWL
jgi:hypothetical protein